MTAAGGSDTPITDTRDSLVERATNGDTEAAAALVILDFLNDNRAWRHVSTDGIFWNAMLENLTWSSGERRLIELGQALWKGHGVVDVVYLFTCLSGGAEQAVVDAITARRGGRQLRIASRLVVSA